MQSSCIDAPDDSIIITAVDKRKKNTYSDAAHNYRRNDMEQERKSG
jgi:hypothetical protein